MPKKSNKPVLPVEPEDWCERMVQRYPNVLWENDAVSISGVPPGWETPVEDLLRAIDEHTRTERSVCDNSWMFKFKNSYNSKLRKLTTKLAKIFDSRKVYKFCNRARMSTDAHYSQATPNPVIIGQIKEKFASLRVYYSGGDERVLGMVWLAENVCSTTCQSSGSRKGVYTNISGWISILDPKVAKKIKKQRGII